MTIKQIASHGLWESPITVDSIINGLRAMSSPRKCSKTGRVYVVEAHSGRNTIIQISRHGNSSNSSSSSSSKDVLPEEYSASNSVYEYGAQALDVLPDGRVIFSNGSDNSVRVLDPDSGKVSLLTRHPVLRYASFHADPKSSWVLAIEEDHTHDTPYEVRNYIVAIHSSSGEVKRVISGADFYFYPQFSADGTRVSWLQWDHPHMLFDHSEVHIAHWDADSVSVSKACVVAGKNQESAAEPRWGPDGSLFFGQELGGYRKLFRLAPGSDMPVLISLKGLDDADLAEVSLLNGSATYAPLSDRYLIATALTNGVARLIRIDLRTNEWQDVARDEGLCDVKGSAVVRLDESSAIVLGAAPNKTPGLYRVNIHDSQDNELLRSSSDNIVPEKFISLPKQIKVKARDPGSSSSPGFGSSSRYIYGFLHMPQNPKWLAPEGELPPLIIWAHGGPTGNVTGSLVPRTQFFTSRGYAYLMLNYTGSTGHGRAYRRNLWGNWGLIDTDDVVDCAEFLVKTGRVRAGAVAITGPSAGGYETLQCISRYPDTFASGVCISGVSDLVGFDDKTHKLEANYTRLLALPEGADEDEKEKYYRQRSSRYIADRIKAPLLLLHGQEDTVVPVEQARIVAEAVKKNNGVVKLIEVAGEGHMMAKPASARLWMEEELKWWRKTLVKRE